MNKKVRVLIGKFSKSIAWYMKQEYHPEYYKYYKKNLSKFQPFITALYWGGENIPNVVSSIIEDIKRVNQ